MSIFAWCGYPAAFTGQGGESAGEKLVCSRRSPIRKPACVSCVAGTDHEPPREDVVGRFGTGRVESSPLGRSSAGYFLDEVSASPSDQGSGEATGDEHQGSSREDFAEKLWEDATAGIAFPASALGRDSAAAQALTTLRAEEESAESVHTGDTVFNNPVTTSRSTGSAVGNYGEDGASLSSIEPWYLNENILFRDPGTNFGVSSRTGGVVDYNSIDDSPEEDYHDYNENYLSEYGADAFASAREAEDAFHAHDLLVASREGKTGGDTSNIIAVKEEVSELSDEHDWLNQQETNEGDDEVAAIAGRLNAGQKVAYDFVLAGSNIFITGSGGTGKTYLCNAIIKFLRSQYEADEIAITAMTGVAAELLQGCTLHSQLGIGSSGLVDVVFGRMRIPTVRSLKVLIIDEVSMVSGEFLDHLDNGFKRIRENPEPFGGIQLVLLGDFYQLPPITESTRSIADLVEQYPEKLNSCFFNWGYAFQSQAWMNGQISIIELREVVRQKDAILVRALQDLRLGKLSPQVWNLLSRTSRPLEDCATGVEPTQLFARIADADEYNTKKLNALNTDSATYEAEDDFYIAESFTRGLETLNSKIFELEDESKRTRREETELKKLKREYEQLEKEIRKARTFLRNRSLVHAFRAKQTLRLRVGAQVMLIQNERSNQEDALVNGSQGIVKGFDDGYPIVEFFNGRIEAVEGVEFRINVAGVGTCHRTQIPLLLSWAITVHKSQGQTLERLRVNLKSMFALGQTYVALSRAKSIEGLETSNLPPNGPFVYKNRIVDNFFADVRDGEFHRTRDWREDHEAKLAAVRKIVEERRERKAKNERLEAEKEERKRLRALAAKQKELDKLERQRKREEKRAQAKSKEAAKNEARSKKPSKSHQKKTSDSEQN